MRNEIFCENCGNKINEYSNFCTTCGKSTKNTGNGNKRAFKNIISFIVRTFKGKRKDAFTYKCKNCKYFNLQWKESILNIKGTSQNIIIWLPLCSIVFNSKNSSLYLATEKCKDFYMRD